MDSTSQSEHAQVTNQDTSYPFYSLSIDWYLTPQTQELLERYSHIPKDQQSRHVHKIRDQAWEISKYPCIGLGVWLTPYISKSPAYETIIQRLKSGDTFLDIGCFVGGDLRQMVFDGAPSANMYGTDIVNHWNVGYDMYQDNDGFKATFIEADICSNDSGIIALTGKIDIISISAVLHMWDWDDQVKVGHKLVRLSKPNSLVVGYQVGNPGGQQFMNTATNTMAYGHDPASFERFWNQIGEETGTHWQTQAALHTFEEMGRKPSDQAWMPPEHQLLDFVVTRLA